MNIELYPSITLDSEEPYYRHSWKTVPYSDTRDGTTGQCSRCGVCKKTEKSTVWMTKYKSKPSDSYWSLARPNCIKP